MDLSRDIDDEEIRQIIRREIIHSARDRPLPIFERVQLEREIFNSLRKLDALQELLEMPGVTEIMINGPDKIFIEEAGRLKRSTISFSSEEKLYDVIQQIVAENNRVVNESCPIVDTKLMDGSRVNVILPPVSVDGATVTIRRFPDERITMEKLLAYGSLNGEIADFLEKLVRTGYNIFVCGGTGSGKTTFLNALTDFVPRDERVITIEDSAELQIRGVENLVRLETRNATLEGKLEIRIRDLVRAALRMRPDRIVVGECRGAEALEVLTAANTGHDGTLSTGHANSCRDMVSRLETMVLMASDVDLPVSAIRKQIASGIDIFIHLGRIKTGERKLLEIAEVMGMEDNEVKLSTLYAYEESGDTGGWIRKNELEHTKKLLQKG
ncbi:MAG: CpaF family protein [Lachnospiraceae bacterium]|nr:CpaF family protein [Lachnospiraceae bacterium]